MAVRKHLLHLKSSALNANGDGPKTPTAQDLEYGEIAINYRDGHERLSIKNSNNEIVSFVSSEVIEENELATAAALAQLNGDIEEVAQTVEDNELVVAAALSDLDSRVMVTEQYDNLEEITYSNLVTKRTNSQLVPGKYYRITDYVTTTVQDDTQSAGHQFDVVVLALDESTLSENAHAMLHDGDTYFSTNGADLSSWGIKYCLDNDTTRFAWVDSTNGKGVIYYMKDEWNNECPYDFKNIQFKRWAVTKTNASSDDPFNNRYVGINNDGEILPNGYDIPNDNDFKWLYTFSGQSVSWDEESDSIIYPDDITRDTEIYDLSNVDMHGFYNENTDPVGCSNNIIKEYYGGRNFAVNTLTLNNIIFTGWFIDVETLPSNYEELYGDGKFKMMSVPFSNTFENECYNNTFGNSVNRNTFGNSCFSNTFGNECYNNSFGNYFQYNTFGNECYNNSFGNSVNRNTFGNSCNSNTFGNSVNRNTFGNYCGSNTFGNSCFSNTFGNYFQYNTFGNYFQYNTFGNRCNNNSFGNSCFSNTFGNRCNNNSFGNGCGSNTFGNECYNNSFGNYCDSNTFVNECYNNSFGNRCNNNSFGNECYNNSFGNSCFSNTFGNSCNSNTFGNNAYGNTFGNSCFSNTFGNAVNHVTFSKDYTYYVIVENGNQHINVTSTQTTSSSNILRNFTIAQGVNNTTTVKTISHNTVNDTFKTTYQPTNSVTVNV